MKNLIAVTVIQLSAQGRLVEITPGSPFSLEDQDSIAYLTKIGAAREPSADEAKTLFGSESTAKPAVGDGGAVGIADLSKATKAELVRLGAEKGLVLDESSSKADLIAAIESHESDEL